MEKFEKGIKKMNKTIHQANDIFVSPRKLLRRLSNNHHALDSSRPPSSETIDTTNNYANGLDVKDRVSCLDEKSDHDQDDQINSSIDNLSQNNQNIFGLNCLTHQIQRHFLKKTFSFNVMVVGQSGLGKSTFVNSFFMVDIYKDKNPGPTKPVSKTLSIEDRSVMIEENGVKVLLTIIDTPGFGDNLNNTNCWQMIEKYIQQQYSAYFDSEFKSNVVKNDSRIHCCLYFIQPTGHSLKPIDLELMGHLHDKVNLVPIIAKADCLTMEELLKFKQNIREDLKKNDIKVFDFPQNEDFGCRELAELMPFAIVSSNYICEQNGQRFFGRQYPWGVVNIQDPKHSDFQALQELLIRRYMIELVDQTHLRYYEHYRNQQMKTMNKN